MIEIWKRLPQNENYKFSSFGNAVYDNGKLKKQIRFKLNDKGYRRLSIYTNGGRITLKVCRIIGELFVDGRTVERNEINHLDGNKVNDSAENIEWCSRSENIKHAYANGLKQADKGINHGNSVICLHVEYGYFCCLNEAADISNKQRANMWKELNGKRKNTTKFILA